MKLFHLSDLHIGLKLFNRDLAEDQTYILDQVIAIAARQQPEVIMIAGDIYDKAVPSAEAVAIFDHFISGLTRAVPQAELMIISGNHDSGSRVNVFRSILQEQKIHMIGLPPLLPGEAIETVALRDQYGPVNFYLLPFVKPSMVRAIVGTDENGNNLSYDAALHQMIGRETIDPRVRNVLVSHQFYLPCSSDPDSVERMDSEICTVGNIDAVRADILEAFDYAALGHIHKPMTVGRAVYRYCGTPLACSVSEAGQQKGIIMVTLAEKGTVSTQVLPLKPLRQVRVIKGTLQEVLTQGCSDYVSILLTDQTDLDIFDMQDKLCYAFPNLLEIRRESLRPVDYSVAYAPEQELDAFALCNAFLKDLDSEDQQLLRKVINQVQEEST
ncbi:exonuclease SbcCD subunit D [Oscillospiraceae bacterium HV4-5-C5C]|nr:exonuclease SbcCD subunit D [Oscillospiraceae bacterium HV4-5-C5C]